MTAKVVGGSSTSSFCQFSLPCLLGSGPSLLLSLCTSEANTMMAPFFVALLASLLVVAESQVSDQAGDFCDSWGPDPFFVYKL